GPPSTSFERKSSEQPEITPIGKDTHEQASDTQPLETKEIPEEKPLSEDEKKEILQEPVAVEGPPAAKVPEAKEQYEGDEEENPGSGSGKKTAHSEFEESVAEDSED